MGTRTLFLPASSSATPTSMGVLKVLTQRPLESVKNNTLEMVIIATSICTIALSFLVFDRRSWIEFRSYQLRRPNSGPRQKGKLNEPGGSARRALHSTIVQGSIDFPPYGVHEVWSGRRHSISSVCFHFLPVDVYIFIFVVVMRSARGHALARDLQLHCQSQWLTDHIDSFPCSAISPCT